jgi:hypothetical protein
MSRTYEVPLPRRPAHTWRVAHSPSLAHYEPSNLNYSKTQSSVGGTGVRIGTNRHWGLPKSEHQSIESAINPLGCQLKSKNSPQQKNWKVKTFAPLTRLPALTDCCCHREALRIQNLVSQCRATTKRRPHAGDQKGTDREEEEPPELIYFKVYKSHASVIEQTIETAALTC